MQMTDTYIVNSCGGHARSIADAILSDCPDAEILFVDEKAGIGERILGFPVVRALLDGGCRFIPGSGDNAKRKRECEGRAVATYIAKSAHIGRLALVGDGCFVASGAHLGPEVQIGRGTIINTNAVVEHNTVVGEFSHVAPNATICGGCRIGNLVLIGAGAVVKPCVSICDEAKIGTGAVVVKDILEPGTYVGIPARKLVKI